MGFVFIDLLRPFPMSSDHFSLLQLCAHQWPSHSFSTPPPQHTHTHTHMADSGYDSQVKREEARRSAWDLVSLAF